MTSQGAEAGKSTFLAANARTPLMCVDADSRFDAVEPLSGGQVLYPSQVINTLDLAEELILRVPKEGVKSLAWDSITKLYSLPTRIGLMKNIQGRAASGNRASSWVDKSNIMTLARDLAILGTDVYYCWHTTSGVDGLGKTEVRDMISAVEKDRLMTSINATLEFFVEDGRYGIRVLRARDYGDRKANVGFVLYDEPGNYWRGGADLLEELMYVAAFGSPASAIGWAAEKLGISLDEATGEYEHQRDELSPENAAQMYTAWYMHVIKITNGKPVIESPPEPEVVSDPAEQAAEQAQELARVVIEARADLAKMGDQIKVGNVVFSAATAWPNKFTADQALLKLQEWPDKPDDVEIRMDRSILGETGLKMFDWLAEVVVE
jgi:hypothetical protein